MTSGLLDDYQSDAELAADFKISMRTLDRWVRLGEAPPHTKIGRRRLFRKQTTADWIRKREQDIEPEAA